MTKTLPSKAYSDMFVNAKPKHTQTVVI